MCPKILRGYEYQSGGAYMQSAASRQVPNIQYIMKNLKNLNFLEKYIENQKLS